MNAAHMASLNILFSNSYSVILFFNVGFHSRLTTLGSTKISLIFHLSSKYGHTVFQSYLTVCHFAFDLSASNLATSLRSWTDTSTFHTTKRIRPMHTTERESPSTIMGILGGSEQPGKNKSMSINLYENSILLNQAFLR